MDEARVVMDMTITEADFRRRLQGAVEGPCIPDGSGFRGGEGGRAWTLRCSPIPGPGLGALALTGLRVELSFRGYAPAEQEAFLRRFRMHFHRGGG